MKKIQSDEYVDLFGLKLGLGELETIDDAIKETTQADLMEKYFSLINKLEESANKGEK